MATLDLTGLEWNLVGWRPLIWRTDKLKKYQPYMGPVRIRLPGSVQQALLEAGLLDDWNYSVNSRKCEWVEHRHWDLSAVIPAGSIPAGERVFLDARGLDYSGWILVDAVEAATFRGALMEHRVELPKQLADGQAHEISIIFDIPPEEQGQSGYTSQSRYFKSRFSYSWDWCPRFVPIGVWDGLALRTGASAAFDLRNICADLAEDNRTGSLELTMTFADGLVPAGDPAQAISIRLMDGKKETAGKTGSLKIGANKIKLSGIPVEAWWPNGAGPQKTYQVEAQVVSRSGAVLWETKRRVGFKRIRWDQCQGAKGGAEPWICVVNGRPVFLQGVNWTPPRLSYMDTTTADYRQLVDVYRDMGCNIFRMWGGAGIERDEFYDMCDEAGILVWQEFPLSSSGMENQPPENDEVLADLSEIARNYIRRLNSHVSLFMWCGGNELTDDTNGHMPGKPCDCSRKAIAMLKRLVENEDPGRRFLPTSASGPKFLGEAKDFGTGLLHDVHGPWGWNLKTDREGCAKFWAGDDALFRSEVGCPSASLADTILKYHRETFQMPPAGQPWRHQAHWWHHADFEELRKQMPVEDAVKAMVARTQKDQEWMLELAAGSCKRRFPRCGGFIMWMGHDNVPCLANCSVVDFSRKPKPVCSALKRIFTTQPADL